MKGITVIRNPQIVLTLTADDWQLFDDEDHPLRDRVARDLNATMQQILNDFDRTDSEKKLACWKYLRMYENWGASDSEGRAVLDTILCMFFGPSRKEA